MAPPLPHARPAVHIRPALLLLALLAASLTALSAIHAPRADASVLWTADGEKPASQEWASSAAPGAACAVAPPNTTTKDLNVTPAPLPAVGPSASHPNAYHFQLNDGEECYGERSELGQSNPENLKMGDRKFYPGQEVWVALEVYLPNDYQLSDPNGYSTGILQFKQTGAHSYPAMGLGNGGGQLCFYIDSLRGQPEPRNCDSGAFELGAPAKNAWVQLLFHMYLSGDKPGESPGFVEIYGNLQNGKGFQLLLPKVVARTSKLNEEAAGDPPLPTECRIGIYRNPLVNGTEDLYVAGFVAATDRASAEEVAFGGLNPVSPSSPSAQPPAGTGHEGSGSTTGNERSGSTTGNEGPHSTGAEGSHPTGGSGHHPRHARSGAASRRVHASRLWLRLSSPRSASAARRGRRVRIVGGVRATSARTGRSVTVEALLPGGWTTLAIAHTRTHGRFSLVTSLPARASALRAYSGTVGYSPVIVTRG